MDVSCSLDPAHLSLCLDSNWRERVCPVAFSTYHPGLGENLGDLAPMNGPPESSSVTWGSFVMSFQGCRDPTSR